MSPLREANGDVPLDGVANLRILGVSRDSKWEDSRFKKSESCCFTNLTISSH